MASYKCIIHSNSSISREYTVTSKSAAKAAAEHGRCEWGEVVTVVRIRSGKVISRVMYSPEYGDYIRISI